MITVIIPTYKRPAMLKRALTSVFEQHAFEEVDSILVSDSSPEGEGREVCENLASRAAIKYVQRDGNLSAHEHGRLIFKEHRAFCRSKLTAILHDDDWWRPAHLANAVNAFEGVKGASFYCGSHFEVRGESSMLNVWSNVCPWFASGYPSNDAMWVMKDDSMLIASVMGGVCHYSSMVIDTLFLKYVSETLEDDRAVLDSDRWLQFKLSRLGPVVYCPIPEVFIRQHPGRDNVANFTKERREELYKQTTRWIMEQSKHDPGALVLAMANQMKAAHDEEKPTLRAVLMQPWSVPLLAEMSNTHINIGN